MQGIESVPSHPWLSSIANVLGGAVSVGVAWFLANLYKRKSKNEIRQANAETERTQAETDDIRVRTGARVGEIVAGLAQKLGETQILVGEMSDQIIALRERVSERNARIIAQEETIRRLEDENKLYEVQVREAQAKHLLES